MAAAWRLGKGAAHRQEYRHQEDCRAFHDLIEFTDPLLCRMKVFRPCSRHICIIRRR
jgi:hypothetical protein